MILPNGKQLFNAAQNSIIEPWKRRRLRSDLVKTSLRQFARNLKHYRASIIVTATGIACLTTLFSAAGSVQKYMATNLGVLGSATLVTAEWDYSRTQRWHHGYYDSLDIGNLKKLSGVQTVSGFFRRKVDLTYRRKTRSPMLFGVDADIFRAQYLPIESGRPILTDEVANHKNVCVIGAELAEKLFQHGEAPLGDYVSISGRRFTIVGVLKKALDPQFWYSVLIPVSVAKSLFTDVNGLETLFVRAVNWDVVPRLHKQVANKLKDRRPGYAESVDVRYLKSRIQRTKRIAFLFKAFANAATVTALIMSAVLLSYLMNVIVTQRTKEIGLRMALGATPSTIRFQFLLEAETVALVGAAIGIIVGILAVQVVWYALGTGRNYIELLLGLLFSSCVGSIVGVISGLIPAMKASKMDCVEALKFE